MHLWAGQRVLCGVVMENREKNRCYKPCLFLAGALGQVLTVSNS